MEKEKYTALEMETIEFDVEDVIRTSPVPWWGGEGG